MRSRAKAICPDSEADSQQQQAVEISVATVSTMAGTATSSAAMLSRASLLAMPRTKTRITPWDSAAQLDNFNTLRITASHSGGGTSAVAEEEAPKYPH